MANNRTDQELQELITGLRRLKCDLLWEKFVTAFDRCFDPNRPRVPAGQPGGGQWVGDNGTPADDPREMAGPRTRPRQEPNRTGRPLRPGPGVMPRGPMPGGSSPAEAPNGANDPSPLAGRPFVPMSQALDRYNAEQALESPTHIAVLEFDARSFDAGLGGVQARADLLRREDVEQICNKPFPQHGIEAGLNDVQTRVNVESARVRAEHPDYTGARFGTAVHYNVAQQINGFGESDYGAERSATKSSEADVRYGTLGSVRVDALLKVRDDLACVMDIRTGFARNPTPARAAEIAGATQRLTGGLQGRILYMTVREQE